MICSEQSRSRPNVAALGKPSAAGRSRYRQRHVCRPTRDYDVPRALPQSPDRQGVGWAKSTPAAPTTARTDALHDLHPGARRTRTKPRSARPSTN